MRPTIEPSGGSPTLTGDATLASDEPSAGDGRAAPLSLQEGDTVGRFVIVRKIGAGGMGVVFLANDPQLERQVAIKLHRSFKHATATVRLQREAKVMARLTHPNVLTVYEVGTHEGHVFIAMEYADGGSLRAWLKAETRRADEIVAMFAEAGRGLAAAHAIGLVHRDFKPDNVLLDARGRPRVADFGLARAADTSTEIVTPAEIDSTSLSPSSPSNRLTTVGAAVGTPSYMPPEQYGPGSATPAADQFAFCASLYEALYDQPPFGGETVAARLMEILADRVREPVPGRAPARLWPILRRGLASDPDARHPDMTRLIDALLADPSARRRRVMAGVGLVGVTAATVWLATAPPPPPDPCEGAAGRLDTVWTQARRDAMADAYLATGSVQAASAAAAATDALQAFADAWSASRIDACRATRVRGEQSDAQLDARVACLDRNLAALDGVVRVLAEPDAKIVASTAAIVEGLPSLHACNDASALQLEIAPPSEAIVDEVTQVRATLGEVQARLTAEQMQDAETRIAPALERAEALGYAPLRVEARCVAGKLHEDLGQYDAAAADLDAALTEAIEIDYATQVPRAAARLAFLVGIRQHRLEEGIRLLGIARAASVRTHGASENVVEGVAALLYREQGNFDAAIEAARRTIAIRKEIGGGADDLAVAWSEHYHYAVLLDEAGRSEEAGREFEAVVAALEKAYGPDDPRLLMPLRGLAVHRMTAGTRQAGAELLLRRVDIAERSQGEHSIMLVQCLRDAAPAKATLDDYDGARELLDRALRIYAELPERTALEHGDLYATKGQILALADECEAALEAFAAADEQYAQVPGPAADRARAVSLENRFACIRARNDQWEAAQQILELRERTQGEDSRFLAQPLGLVARLTNDRGDFPRALEVADRGLRLVASDPGASPEVASVLRRARSRALVGTGDTAAAIVALGEELAAYQDQPPDAERKARGLLDAGRSLWTLDPSARAKAHAAVVEAGELAEAEPDEAWASSVATEAREWLAHHRAP